MLRPPGDLHRPAAAPNPQAPTREAGLWVGPRRGAYRPWVVACPEGLIHDQVASVLYINPVQYL